MKNAKWKVTRQVRLPIGKERVKKSSHQVEPSKVDLTVLLTPVHFLLYLETFILKEKNKHEIYKAKQTKREKLDVVKDD